MGRQAVSQAETTVYIARDRAGTVLYIGITGTGVTRGAQHWKNSEWWQYSLTEDKEHYPTRRQALVREAELIRRHRPPFNKQQNPGWENLHRKYLEQAEPHRYGHAAALEMAEALDWWVPLHPVSRRHFVVTFEAETEHVEITSRWINCDQDRVLSEAGEEIGIFRSSGRSSGKSHVVQFYEQPREPVTSCRVWVSPVSGRERFVVKAIVACFSKPTASMVKPRDGNDTDAAMQGGVR
jgi:predicted GIY-YIG superfamily endonuclease